MHPLITVPYSMTVFHLLSFCGLAICTALLEWLSRLLVCDHSCSCSCLGIVWGQTLQDGLTHMPGVSGGMAGPLSPQACHPSLLHTWRKLCKRIRTEAVRFLELGLSSHVALLVHFVGQSESQGQSRFKRWRNRFHILMWGATKNLGPFYVSQR